jgi:transcription initiation factor IIE alpha subunit
MNTDGNTYAINRRLAEQEAYDASLPHDMLCLECDEKIHEEDFPAFIANQTCPNCGNELEEIL